MCINKVDILKPIQMSFKKVVIEPTMCKKSKKANKSIAKKSIAKKENNPLKKSKVKK